MLSLIFLLMSFKESIALIKFSLNHCPLLREKKPFVGHHCKYICHAGDKITDHPVFIELFPGRNVLEKFLNMLKVIAI